MSGKPKYNPYLKYSGMASQLLVMLLLGVWLGGKADAYLALDKPWMTILIIFVFMAGWFTKLYYDLGRPNDDS